MDQQVVTDRAQLYSAMFQFQEEIFNNALVDLSDELAVKRITANSNHINWLLGHCLHCRYMLANMLGLKEENPFGKIYWSAIEDKAYPGIKEVISYWPLISNKLIARLSTLNDSELDARQGDDESTLKDILSFFSYHEAYHLGQIGIVRKAIGLPTLRSN